MSKDKKCRTCSIEQSHIGEVINGIEIVKYSHSDKTGNKYYWFKCYCGNEFLSIYSFVNSGHTRSCGCLTNKYGNLSKDPRYRNWVAMVQRTTNKNHKAYKHYHDIIQGTVIEKSWVESPEEFYKEIGEKPGKNYTIDRINNSKGYVRGNVKWSTRSEQQLNRFTKRGETGEKYIYKDKRRNAYVAYAYNKTIGMKYIYGSLVQRTKPLRQGTNIWKNRYGSWVKALAHSYANGWY